MLRPDTVSLETVFLRLTSDDAATPESEEDPPGAENPDAGEPADSGADIEWELREDDTDDNTEANGDESDI
jgi:hypothetical protein